MLNKGFRIVWVKVHINDKKSFHLNLPISFYAFEELLDCFMDLLNFACFFEPHNYKPAFSTLSMHTIRDLLEALIKLFDSITFTEPYDLVEVELENVRVSVRIR